MAEKYKFDWSKVKEDVKESGKKPGFKADERFWKPTVDEKGNATAIIRFIPDSEGTPFVKFYTHNFTYMLDGVKKYWIRNCVNTFGYERECPICKKNQEYWNSSFPTDKTIASQRKRKLTFIANILVIKNPAKPEDEGKIFLYQFGQKIYDKIKDKMYPSEEMKALGEGSYDEYIPFDLYEGADFKLVQVKQGEFPNYDKSEFGKQKPLGTDKVIDSVMSKTIQISEFIADDKFPTNSEVITKLGSILGLVASTTQTDQLLNETPTNNITSTSIVDEDIPDFSNSEGNDESEEDDEANFFKNLR